MPDYAVMESLCDILKINVNELLSGERLPLKDYNKKGGGKHDEFNTGK